MPVPAWVAHVLAAMGEVPRSGVAGGVPPLGAFNPPPTEGVQGVLDPNHIAYNQSSRSYHKWPSS